VSVSGRPLGSTLQNPLQTINVFPEVAPNRREKHGLPDDHKQHGGPGADRRELLHHAGLGGGAEMSLPRYWSSR